MTKSKNYEPIDTMFVSLPISEVELNEGQIDGLPSNPLSITDEKYEKLKKNIQEHPEMLKVRGLIVYPYGDKFIVIGGNMRLRAMQELGFKTVPSVVLPKETDVEELKAYTVLDNSGFGRWDWSMLANEWEQEQLIDWGVDLPILGEEINPDEFFDEVDGGKEKGESITVSIPDDAKEEKEAIRQAIENAVAKWQGCKVK